MNNPERPAHPALQSEHTPESFGLSKREYIAAMAMQGLCAHSIHGAQHHPSELAREAVEYADALLKKLEL